MILSKFSSITPKQRYNLAIKYLYPKKIDRKIAIQYLENYLNNPIYTGAYEHKFRYYNQPIEERKNEHISDFYNALAIIYEKEYNFVEALKNYEKAIFYSPHIPISYNGKVSILIKQNKIEDAIAFINNIKNSIFYKKNDKFYPDNWFIKTIDSLLEQCIKLKEKGYIYKPRKVNMD